MTQVYAKMTIKSIATPCQASPSALARLPPAGEARIGRASPGFWGTRPDEQDQDHSTAMGHGGACLDMHAWGLGRPETSERMTGAGHPAIEAIPLRESFYTSCMPLPCQTRHYLWGETRTYTRARQEVLHVWGACMNESVVRKTECSKLTRPRQC